MSGRASLFTMSFAGAAALAGSISFGSFASLASLTSAAAGCGASSSSPSSAAAPVMPENQIAAVRGAIEQWRQAYEVRSLDVLARRYAQTDETVLVQQGAQTRGWPAIQALLTERLGRAKDVRVRLKDVAVAPIGSDGAAVVAGMSREISDGVTTVTEEGVLTLTLRGSGGDWTIVSEHYSYLAR